jgi:hypothetical protein
MHGIPSMILLAPAGVNALAAIALEPFRDGKGVPEPRGRKVVADDLFERLEYLELVPPHRAPESNHGLDRRAAGHGARDLPHVDLSVRRQPEALARPPDHPLDDLEARWAFLDPIPKEIHVAGNAG